MDAGHLVQLFDNVLTRDINKNNISKDDIRLGVESMREVYQHGKAKLNSLRSSVANYNDPAYRCAYLLKFGAFHTAMVRDFLYRALQKNYALFYRTIFSPERKPYSICCLGGGPGNDVIAVLSAYHLIYSFFPVDATVIDYMKDWEYSFQSILNELGSVQYGSFGSNAHGHLAWRYLGANLLTILSPEVEMSIAEASLVTMVKFVSATACKNTKDMINNVFSLMKPGAVLLFIDNRNAGYHEMIMNAATKFKFETLFGPFHRWYCNPGVRKKTFGLKSCYRTFVTVHVLMKSYPFQEPSEQFFPGLSMQDESPVPQRYVYEDNPLTPLIYVAPKLGVRNVAETMKICSPCKKLLQSPNNPPVTCLVAEQVPRGKDKKKRVRCRPKKKCRQNAARKIDRVKSRAKKVLLKKSTKKHPIFEL